MRTILLLAAASLAAATAAATAASAQAPHAAHRRDARHDAAHREAGRHVASRSAPAGFNAGAAQVPPPGFYDGYQGPGSTVLKRGNAAQYEPGATEEIAPGAKQTATGGPVGGVPGFGGGM